MAIIGSIRKRSGLLIVMIGVALLLFLLGDLFSNGGSAFRSQDNTIGEIAGKEITQREFELRFQDALDQQFGTEGANDMAKQQLRERVWNDFVNELIFKKEYDRLGISVSPDELLDQIKNTGQGSILQQLFTDPNTGQVIEQFRDPNTGALDPQKVLVAVQNILNSDNADQWLPIEAALKEDVIRTKYNNLLGKGIFTTSLEAKQMFVDKNTTVSFSYAVKEYNAIPEGEVEITDADLKEYYNAHKSEELYQNQDETRDIKLVQFELSATPEDIAELRAEMEEIKAGFEADSNDTAYVLENAEGQLQNLVRYFKEQELPSMLKDTIIKSDEGTVFGPYDNGPMLYVSKLVSTSMSPDSVQASHILIRVDDGDSNKIAAAKIKLDSIKTVATRNGNFADLAKEFSDDLGSGENGGELDWFTKGRMVPPFEKACFEGKVGDMPIVVSQFGVHLIHITDQTEPRKSYLLASVDMPIEPSKYTADMVYKKASKFSVENNTIEKFEASEMEIIPIEGLRAEEEVLGPLGIPAKEVVRWAHNEETVVGAVSSPFELDDRIVVSVVTKIREEGVVPFETAKGMIRPMVLEQKKAEKIMAELGTFTSIEEAAKNIGVEVRRADNVRLSDQSIGGGIGREPSILGTASTLATGEMSAPIKGNRGVYVLKLEGKTDAPSDGDSSQDLNLAKNNNFVRAQRSAQNALKDAVGVEDDRAKFY